MANAITRVITALYGNLVGSDADGNRYYEHKKVGANGRRRRWVVYKNSDEASNVPAAYHAWLHYTLADFPKGEARVYAWEKDHIPNMTGTGDAYLPKGHALAGGERSKATGDYEAWSPDS